MLASNYETGFQKRMLGGVLQAVTPQLDSETSWGRPPGLLFSQYSLPPTFDPNVVSI